jgi:hypothetical protein
MSQLQQSLIFNNRAPFFKKASLLGKNIKRSQGFKSNNLLEKSLKEKAKGMERISLILKNNC